MYNNNLEKKSDLLSMSETVIKVTENTMQLDKDIVNRKCSDSDVIKGDEAVKEGGDETRGTTHRENRLTSIIDQLRCQNKMKGSAQQDFTIAPSNAAEGSGGAARRRARDAASPAHAPPAAPAPPAPPAPYAHSAHSAHSLLSAPSGSSAASVKTERQSPHDSIASSVTPSTSSYPGTPPERGSPHAPPAAPATALQPRNYSDIMRSLAARYNSHQANDYFHRVNGYPYERPLMAIDINENSNFVGLVSCLTKQLSNVAAPSRSPAVAIPTDMSMSKYMSKILRKGNCGRRRRYAMAFPPTEHSPLDLSSGGDTAAKRARLSPSYSSRSDGDDRERSSNEDRSDSSDCLCAEARARLTSWSVDEVYDFVSSIDICAEYALNFREQRIDGSGLPLLTEDHLTGMLKMKLGPALKLRAVVARRLESCAHCVATAARTITPCTSTPSPTTNTVKVNGTSLKSEPRSNTTSPS